MLNIAHINIVFGSIKQVWPLHIFSIEVPVTSHESEWSCACVRGIDFASFDDFSIGLWNCPDSVVSFCFFILLQPLHNGVMVFNTTFKHISGLYRGGEFYWWRTVDNGHKLAVYLPWSGGYFFGVFVVAVMTKQTQINEMLQ